jgi:hypothetical protein
LAFKDHSLGIVAQQSGQAVDLTKKKSNTPWVDRSLITGKEQLTKTKNRDRRPARLTLFPPFPLQHHAQSLSLFFSLPAVCKINYHLPDAVVQRPQLSMGSLPSALVQQRPAYKRGWPQAVRRNCQGDREDKGRKGKKERKKTQKTRRRCAYDVQVGGKQTHLPGAEDSISKQGRTTAALKIIVTH